MTGFHFPLGKKTSPLPDLTGKELAMAMTPSTTTRTGLLRSPLHLLQVVGQILDALVDQH